MQQATTAKPEPFKGNGKSAPVLMPERMGLAEAKRHDWVVDVDYGVTPEMIMEPAFWAHVAQSMVPGDHIEVRAEDFSWIAYLVVHYAERTYAKVKLDRLLNLDKAIDAPAISIKHKVEWKGPHLKFVVIRVSDSKVLKDAFLNRTEAETWIRSHEAAQ